MGILTTLLLRYTQKNKVFAQNTTVLHGIPAIT
jgi:hypothetical protein